VRTENSIRIAAFEVATGKVRGAHKKRRRRKEFLDFMDEIVADYPKTRPLFRPGLVSPRSRAASVNRDTLTVGRPLPFCPYEQISSHRSGMSEECQTRT
jgi:hypothetical protein